MSVLDLLSSSHGQNGSEANISLAKEIADSENHDAIKELVEDLSNQDKKNSSRLHQGTLRNGIY